MRSAFRLWELQAEKGGGKWWELADGFGKISDGSQLLFHCQDRKGEIPGAQFVRKWLSLKHTLRGHAVPRNDLFSDRVRGLEVRRYGGGEAYFQRGDPPLLKHPSNFCNVKSKGKTASVILARLSKDFKQEWLHHPGLLSTSPDIPWGFVFSSSLLLCSSSCVVSQPLSHLVHVMVE